MLAREEAEEPLGISLVLSSDNDHPSPAQTQGDRRSYDDLGKEEKEEEHGLEHDDSESQDGKDGDRSRLDSAGSLYSEWYKPTSSLAPDPYYQGRFGFGQYPLQFNKTVLGCVSRNNPARALCISIMRSSWFEYVILVLILVNSILLAIYNPVDEILRIPNDVNSVTEDLEWFFQVAFSLEAIIKILALGLRSKPSGYFRESWNVLDFCIVVLGWIPLIQTAAQSDGADRERLGTSSLAVVRSVRVLRPLRALHLFPKLKQLVNAILRSAKSIAEVMLLCFVVLLLFALVGVTLFKGKLRQHCGYWNVASDSWVIPTEELEEFCSLDSSPFGRKCPESMTCIVTDVNPNLGLQSFDNVLYSLLTVLQIITLEGWSTIMYALFDTTFRFVGIYFILLILFGSFFMINLVISALSVNYMQVRQENDQKKKLELERETFMDRLVEEAEYKASLIDRFLDLPVDMQKRHMQMRLMLSYEANRDNPFYNIVSQQEFEAYSRENADLYPTWKRKYQHRLAKLSRPRSTNHQHRVRALLVGKSSTTTTESSEFPSRPQAASSSAATSVRSLATSASNDEFSEPLSSLHQLYSRYGNGEEVSPPSSGTDSAVSDSDSDDGARPQLVHRTSSSLSEYMDAESFDLEKASVPPIPMSKQNSDRTTSSAFTQESQHTLPTGLNTDLTSTESDARGKGGGGGAGGRRRAEPKGVRVPFGARPDAPAYAKWIYVNIVHRPWFKMTVMVLILINTAVMASEFFGMPPWMFTFQEVSNIVFLALYTLELVLRILACGPVFFFGLWFNRFDFLIVVAGYLELIFEGNSFASVFRILRILRFLKLAHYWKTFDNLIDALQETVKQLCPFLVFFSLLLYIFTISGLHLLGGQLVIEPNITEEMYSFSFQSSPTSSKQATINVTQTTEVSPNPDFDCTKDVGSFYLSYPNGTHVWHCPERVNYDTFLWSLVSTFQVITGEDWNGVMFLVVEQTGSYWYVLYFLFLVLFGTYIILNFFLAILIDTFVALHIERENEKARKQAEKARQRRERRKNRMTKGKTHLGSSSSSSMILNTISGEDRPSEIQTSFLTRETTPAAGQSADLEMVSLTPIARSPESPNDEANQNGSEAANREDARVDVAGTAGRPSDSLYTLGKSQTSESPQNFRRNRSSKFSSLQDVVQKRQEKTYNLTEEEILQLAAFEHNALCCIPPTNRARIFCAKVVFQTWFDILILAVILASCVLLALDSPDNKLPAYVTEWLNVIIVIVFFIEAALKIVALGFVTQKGSYLRDGWNVLDFIILLISILDVSLPNATPGSFQVLRALRALRPLRAIQKFDGLRVVIKSFTSAIIPCFQVMVLCMVFYGIFSICSVSFFQGRLFACYECPLGVSAEDRVCQRSYPENSRDTRCMVYPDYGVTEADCPAALMCQGVNLDKNVSYEWLLPTYGSLTFTTNTSTVYSFDSFFSSFLLLFELSSMEIWMEPMYAVSDIVDIGMSPVRGSNDAASLFFLVALFVLQFFMLQVFVAVLLDTYFDSASEEKGDAFMTPEQRKWVDYNRMALSRPFKAHSSLSRPDNTIRRVFYDVAVSERFGKFILGVIIVNTAFLMTEHYDESETYIQAAFVLDYIFGVIYILEALIKIIGLGIVKYFSHKANVFDFVIVLAIICSWITDAFIHDYQEFEALFRSIEALRVLRVLRIFKFVPWLRPLIATLLLTIYPLLNILGLIMLVLFIYSILGMQLFGEIDDATFPGNQMEFITEHINFRNFPNAFFTLFVMSTGESWNGVMHDLAIVSPHGTWYCLSFVVVMQLFLLNLFVAVILASFSSQFENNQRPKGVKEHLDDVALRHYNREWNVLHCSFVNMLSNNLKSAEKTHDPAVIFKAQKKLYDAKENPLFLPASMFPELMLRLKAPLGFRKRSSTAKFNYSHVLRYVKDKHIPVTKQGFINFYSTLSALININVLQGEVPTDVEQFLQLKVANLNRSAQTKKSMSSSTSTKDSNAMTTILAREQIKLLIENYALHWKMRYMKKHGASDERIRRFLEESLKRNRDSRTLVAISESEKGEPFDTSVENHYESQSFAIV